MIRQTLDARGKVIFLEDPRWQMAIHQIPVSAQSSPNPRPSPWHHRRSGPAQMRCEKRLPKSHKGAQSEVTNSTLQLRAALDKHNRNAEVSLCHRCAFVPVNPLGCFWIDSDYILKAPKCLCYCLSAQGFVEHLEHFSCFYKPEVEYISGVFKF